MGFPKDVLADIDSLVQQEDVCRSEFIREACYFYMEEKRKSRLREKMKAGYQEMAEINRVLAERISCDFEDKRRVSGTDASGNTSGWGKT